MVVDTNPLSNLEWSGLPMLKFILPLTTRELLVRSIHVIVDALLNHILVGV
jgi:hypothetical protein